MAASSTMTLTTVTWDIEPGVNQTATVKYALASSPTDFTTVTTDAPIVPAGGGTPLVGNFTPPVAITGLTPGAAYIFVAINNCNASQATLDETMPLPNCVNITSVSGTATTG